MSQAINVPVSPGELIDKITILEIKSERMRDAAQLNNVRTELASLLAVCDRHVPSSHELSDLTRQLKAVNESLWQIEDEIRGCESSRDFGPQFVELARSVYRENDRRAQLKRDINVLLGSQLMEEKAYNRYL